MQVIMKSREDLTKEDLYFLVVRESEKMQNLAGQTIHVDDWVITNDIDKETGEPKQIIFIKSGDTTYGSVSKTFIESFKTIVSCFGNDGFSNIKVIEGKSNKGRTFIQCEYVKNA